MKTAKVTRIEVAIVDDHFRYRESLTEYVSTYGCSVVIKTSCGVELLRLLQTLRAPPTYCIIDLDMTYEDGYNTAKEVLYYWPSIKIIILSMSMKSHMERKCLNLGVHHYLQKYYAARELKKILLSGHKS